jgi:hypothetical protein
MVPEVGQAEHCHPHIGGSRAAMTVIYSLLNASKEPPINPLLYLIFANYFSLSREVPGHPDEEEQAT